MTRPTLRWSTTAARAAWIACLWLCLLPAAHAQAEDQSTIPDLPPALLVDQAGALSDAERIGLSDRLQQIQASGRAQVAILVSAGLAGEPLADFSLRVAEAWQLGRAGRDDGLLILVVPSAPAARIEVGYGLEGAIPDARAAQWLDDLLPAIRQEQLAAGLDRLLDQVDAALPAAEALQPSRTVFDKHPEWGGPFAMIVFSLFAIFPMFAGRWGSVASGPLLGAFLGMPVGMLMESAVAGWAVAGAMLPLPYLWGLNFYGGDNLAPWLRHLRTFANLIAVALFFSIITLFVGVGLSVADFEPLWAAPIFAGLLATGLAILLFPGQPAHYLSLGLRSAMHFIFILIVAYVAMGPFVRQPGGIAFAAAGTVTACLALGFYLDGRDARTRGGTRWALWLYGLAFLVALPFALVALMLSVVGEDLVTQIAQGTAGGGSLLGIGWLAARLGLFAAVRVGLGGLFGGGGAGRGG